MKEKILVRKLEKGCMSVSPYSSEIEGRTENFVEYRKFGFKNTAVYINIWYLYHGKEYSMVFDQFKTFDKLESSHK